MEDEPPDGELQHLVSLLVDRNLTDEQRLRLEQRMRDEPEAERYCARALRFEATLQEALDPQKLEWEETRRLTFDPTKGSSIWSVQLQQTMRFGSSERTRSTSISGKRLRWFGAIGLLALSAASVMLYVGARSNSYQLRNGDFEAMDLSQNPTGIDKSILFWQDYFSADGTDLCELGRVTHGRVYAKSGRNAVRLQNGSFLNQIILNKAGRSLKAVPGMRVILTGWVYGDGPEEHSLRSSLRFVASGYPDMVQYQAATDVIKVQSGGWHPLKMEMVLSKDLSSPPGVVRGRYENPPPMIDLDGKGLTLSLDSLSPVGSLLLDDLKLEIFNPEE